MKKRSSKQIKGSHLFWFITLSIIVGQFLTAFAPVQAQEGDEEFTTETAQEIHFDKIIPNFGFDAVSSVNPIIPPSSMGNTNQKKDTTNTNPSSTTKPTAPSSNSSINPSQVQKDVTARVCKRVALNRKDIYQKFNISTEQFVSTCYYDLLAMAYAESRFDCTATGDQGRSHGCFQIQTSLHKITINQAENYEWAAEWTLDRMVRDNDYPHLRTIAIMRHNGAGKSAEKYAASVKTTSQKFKAAGL